MICPRRRRTTSGLYRTAAGSSSNPNNRTRYATGDIPNCSRITRSFAPTCRNERPSRSSISLHCSTIPRP